MQAEISPRLTCIPNARPAGSAILSRKYRELLRGLPALRRPLAYWVSGTG